MDYILPNKDDILYIYIEPWFTGFAPCFDDNLYSLSCCMGKKNNGGMKASAARLKNSGKNVWILSVAGKPIKKIEKDGSKHNCTSIDYSPNDIIYLAKVGNTYTWEEYFNKYAGRKDAIYKYENGSFQCVNSSIHTIENAERDCALGHKEYRNLKQIITSELYYIFKNGIQLPDGLTKNRTGAYKNNNPQLISKFITKENIAYINKNPFDLPSFMKGSCSK